MTLDDAIAECPVLAIIRGVNPDEATDIAGAIYEAGIRAVEVPLNSPDPFRSIERLAQTFGDTMCCGAGTVLDPADVDRVADAGGRIVVAPNVSVPVIARALALGLDPAPGFATATEAFLALGAGARHLKLFPAVTYGPAHLRQLSAVLPRSTVVWAVGGVGADNLAAWRKAGAKAFGIGGEVYKPGQSVQETLRKAAELVGAARVLPTQVG
jgi:2-dehydro-3-deoxyphosphogalactonate aldolase